MVNTRATIKKLPMQSEASVVSSDDLLIVIFLRLPVTSVVRFKFVSKHWQSLLSHRSFTLLYKSISISLGLFIRNLYIPFDDEKKSSPPFRALDFYRDPCGIRILQSCNGLLLCCSDRGTESDRKYYVFSPTTKQFALIPSAPGAGDVGRTMYAMGLAFHQTDCAHYKVVCIVKGNERLYQIQTYSSDTGTWKISHQSLADRYQLCSGVYWNQAIYWYWHRWYFNLKTEKVQCIPTLRLGSFGACEDYFGESGGHLHLVKRSEHGVKVYEMLNDHSEWFLKYRVELNELLNACPDIIRRQENPFILWYDFQVLDYVRGEEEEDETFIVIRIPEKVIRYNVADKSFKKISHLSKYVQGIRFWEVHRYIATLVSF